MSERDFERLQRDPETEPPSEFELRTSTPSYAMGDPDQLAEIKARRAAVKGMPWELDGDEIIDPAGQVVAEVIGRTNPEFIAHAPTDIDWLIAKVEHQRGLLKRLEWAGCYLDEDDSRWAACPACGAENPPYGAVSDFTPHHKPGCWLAAELAPQRKEAPPRPEA